MDEEGGCFLLVVLYSINIFIDLRMFESFLPLEPISSSKSLDSVRSGKECATFDLQFEICSRYVKMTSEQLYQREI